MGSHAAYSEFNEAIHLSQRLSDPLLERKWYAVFTIPQNEKSAIKHLQLRNVESFLPTYETIRVWKNRQRAKILLPLFPSYLFVHVNRWERVQVLRCPGVLNLVGNGRQCISLEDTEIEFLRSGFNGRKPQPFNEFAVGEKVRIKAGIMRGVEGILVRKNNSLRFVLTINLINQYAAVEVDADALETVRRKN